MYVGLNCMRSYVDSSLESAHRIFWVCDLVASMSDGLRELAPTRGISFRRGKELGFWNKVSDIRRCMEGGTDLVGTPSSQGVRAESQPLSLGTEGENAALIKRISCLWGVCLS